MYEADGIAGVAFRGRGVGARDPLEGAGAVGGALLHRLDQGLVVGRSGKTWDGWGAKGGAG